VADTAEPGAGMSVGLPIRTEPHSPPPAGSDDDGLPLTVVEPRAGWRVLDLRELWRFRELLLFLIWRDVKIRYKQTAIGAAWAVLQPVAVMGAFAFALGRVAGSPGAAVPYWLFVLCGLVPWTFFAAVLTQSGRSVVNNQQLVGTVYFPRLLLPLSAAGLAGVDFLVGFGLLLVAAACVGFGPGWGVLLVPVVAGVLALLSLGLGVIFAALTVKYRDFRVVVPLLVQLGMFLTPAIYDQSGMTGGRFGQVVQVLNPVNGVIHNFRAAVLGGPFDWAALAVSGTIGLALFTAGAAYFRRVERGFADVI
jgi:lipopolysaccharide transport system permease protein